MKEKVIKLAVLTLLFMAIGFKTFAQERAVKGHERLQEYYSYERWKDGQPKVRILQARAAVKQKRNGVKNSRYHRKLNRKVARIRKQIDKL
jgi:hypothetical protein